MSEVKAKRVPVTVFTGYLGAGKTTIILNVIKQVPADKYKIVWLKNEIGDVQVDSLVAKENNIASMELVDGCLCCVQVGLLGNALDDILSKFTPDRIIIETSGSAYPAPIAWEVRKNEALSLDGIVNVVDVRNFAGYQDKSKTAKMQTKYTDLILLNKHEDVSERDLDTVLDDVIELNPETPRVKTDKGAVMADLVFGHDTTLFETCGEGAMGTEDKQHQHREVDLIYIIRDATKVFGREVFEAFLKGLSPEDVYRAKGTVNLGCGAPSAHMLNYVAGRYTLEPLTHFSGETRLVLMGELSKRLVKRIVAALQLADEDIELKKRVRH